MHAIATGGDENRSHFSKGLGCSFNTSLLDRAQAQSFAALNNQGNDSDDSDGWSDDSEDSVALAVPKTVFEVKAEDSPSQNVQSKPQMSHVADMLTSLLSNRRNLATLESYKKYCEPNTSKSEEINCQVVSDERESTATEESAARSDDSSSPSRDSDSGAGSAAQDGSEDYEPDLESDEKEHHSVQSDCYSSDGPTPCYEGHESCDELSAVEDGGYLSEEHYDDGPNEWDESAYTAVSCDSEIPEEIESYYDEVEEETQDEYDSQGNDEMKEFRYSEECSEADDDTIVPNIPAPPPYTISAAFLRPFPGGGTSSPIPAPPAPLPVRTISAPFLLRSSSTPCLVRMSPAQERRNLREALKPQHRHQQLRCPPYPEVPYASGVTLLPRRPCYRPVPAPTHKDCTAVRRMGSLKCADYLSGGWDGAFRRAALGPASTAKRHGTGHRVEGEDDSCVRDIYNNGKFGYLNRSMSSVNQHSLRNDSHTHRTQPFKSRKSVESLRRELERVEGEKKKILTFLQDLMGQKRLDTVKNKEKEKTRTRNKKKNNSPDAVHRGTGTF